MAFDAFLKLDGVPGESQDAVHKGEIEIMSFSWAEALPAVQRGGPGGGGGAGRVSFQDFHFSKLSDSASPLLFQACATGKHLKTATLSIRKAGGDSPTVAGAPQDFIKWNLQTILVSSYETGGGIQDDGSYSPVTSGDFDVPVDQFTLNFQKIEFDFVSPVTGASNDVSIDTNALPPPS